MFKFVKFNKHIEKYKNLQYKINVINIFMKYIFILYAYGIIDVNFFSICLMKLYKV